MITEDQIKTLIQKHKDDLQKLETVHQQMVNEYQQRIVANQNRFQQLTGAVTELQQLLNGAQPIEGKNNG